MSLIAVQIRLFIFLTVLSETCTLIEVLRHIRPQSPQARALQSQKDEPQNAANIVVTKRLVGLLLLKMQI